MFFTFRSSEKETGQRRKTTEERKTEGKEVRGENEREREYSSAWKCPFTKGHVLLHSEEMSREKLDSKIGKQGGEGVKKHIQRDPQPFHTNMDSKIAHPSY